MSGRNGLNGNRQDSGTSTWNVETNPNWGSRVIRLCRWVVPVRQCPRINTGGCAMATAGACLFQESRSAARSAAPNGLSAVTCAARQR